MKKAVQVLLYILAAMALITGALEVFMGISSQLLFGAELPPEVLVEPVFNSQYRFTSLMWFGMGFFILIFVRDLKRYEAPIKLLLWLVLIAGIIRIPTMLQYGLPENQFGLYYIITMMIGEILGGIAGLLMFRQVVNNNFK